VAGISRFKRFPEICSNFRTFLLSFHKIYGRKISGTFPAETFRKIIVIFPESSGKIPPEISQLTGAAVPESTDEKQPTTLSVQKCPDIIPWAPTGMSQRVTCSPLEKLRNVIA